MSNRVVRAERYHDTRALANRLAHDRAAEAAATMVGSEHSHSEAEPDEPGDVDPQFQMMMNAFTAALAQVPAFQAPPVVQPAAVPPQAVPPPAGNVAPVIQYLPNNTIKLPLFTGTIPDPKDPTNSKKKIKCSPASVVSALARMDAFFEAYQHSYPTDTLKLIALLGCFPTFSAAAYWYEGDSGKEAFGSYTDFKVSFLAHFGASKADVLKYDHDFLHFKMHPSDSVSSYYTSYLQLLAEMKAVGKPVQSQWQITKFVDGLVPRLYIEVNRIFRRYPEFTLEDLMNEAEMEEKTFKPPTIPKPTGITPQLKGFQGKGKYNNKPKQRFACFWCKTNEHTHTSCPKIAAKRADGTWEDRPRDGAGPSK